jgi:hypothetical protein
VITDVPADIPVTIPDEEPITVFALLLDHVPAPVLLSKVVAPTQTFITPVIGGGAAVTVTVTEAEQVFPKVYVTSAVPGATPVTMPVEEPIVAADPLTLHTPPPASLSVVV